MKTSPLLHRRSHSRGGATLAVVAAISLALLSMLTYTVIASLNSFENQSSAQIKQDYSQKEDALLTALLHIVPNKAIGAMQEGSMDNQDDFTWATIFDEAISVANAEQSVSPNLLSSLNLDDAILANTGDAPIGEAIEIVKAPVRSYADGDNLVNGGNWWEFYMLGDPIVGPSVPAPLQVSYDHYLLDKKFPIISFDKVYNYWYRKGVELPAESYPLYNMITYPDVKFGYKRPGELFVAKRNWWIFSLTFGELTAAQTGVPPVTKNYVLSIYEIPSQLPLSATSLMKVGQFADGSAWEKVSVTGGVYADALETEGTVEVSGGSLSARSSVNLSETTTVDGETIEADFDQMGKREARALESQSDFYDASVGGNVGRVAFIPLNSGDKFLQRSSDGDASSRISPTGWKDYTRGANQAAMRLEVREMVSDDSQIPVEIRLRYRDTSNNFKSATYRRGENWPAEFETGGNTFPFQTDQLENQRNALVVYLDRLPALLASFSDAAGLDVNNSIHIYPQHWRDTVIRPSIPSLDSDLAVTLRGGRDMSPFSKGFSVVTDMRLYIAETMNDVATSPPANSGLPANAEFYPPISLFAPEKRFGESLTINHPVTIRGQLSTLKTNNNDTFNPLEFIGADDTRVASDLLEADLISLRSPAELPPIHMMNWMVTIEEIH
ncbi:MAG: hypothetical protein P1U85_18515 [Verrucomicrobiales bacterium]|nr:hypothetical protein [Verrucomicrobiales bacterium]